MLGKIVNGGNRTVSDDLSFEVLRDDEHRRPSNKVIEIEFPCIVFGEWIKVAKIQP